ncbi:MAG: phosphoenolpyruvate carboxykinase (ATP), partial [Candidatus Eremiobacteraeota bacterium]|nr:phosphoenolpyruvate carboxykinase (ATP) [Candidatus Eremiobacteraeota bacterium]
MQMALITGTSIGLESFGIGPVAGADINLSPAALYEESIRRGEGMAAIAGPLVVQTGKHTGRSPQDKFFVKEPGSESHIDWGKTNKPFDAGAFEALLGRVDAYLRDQHVFVVDAFAGADPDYRLPVRVATTQAWQAL